MSSEHIPEGAEQKSASHNPFKNKEIEAQEVPEVLKFLKENGTSILVGAAVAAAAFLGWSIFRNTQSSQQAAAAAQIFNAQSAEQIQQAVNAYPKTPAASLGQLILAGQAYDQGQFEVAHNLFAQFVENYPTHEFRNNAALGIIQCTEAQGNYAEALDGYTRFASEHPDGYLTPAATFGQARCLELLGRAAEAKTVYTDFLAGREKTDVWHSRATSALAMLEKDMRAQARGDKVQLIEPPAPPTLSFPGIQDSFPALATPTPAAP